MKIYGSFAKFLLPAILVTFLLACAEQSGVNDVSVDARFGGNQLEMPPDTINANLKPTRREMPILVICMSIRIIHLMPLRLAPSHHLTMPIGLLEVRRLSTRLVSM